MFNIELQTFLLQVYIMFILSLISNK